MSRDYLTRCQCYLSWLQSQLDKLAPAPTGAYGDYVETLPLERLPTVVSLIREFIECSAIVTDMERALDADEAQPQTEAS